MKTNFKRQSAVITAGLIITILFSGCSRLRGITITIATDTPIPTLAPTATPIPPPTQTTAMTVLNPGQTPAGDVIPLKPLSNLTSLNATVNITADGSFNGKPAQGDLKAELTTNDQKQSQVVVTGSLLGDIVAQVGGSAVSLFRPSKVTLYKVPEGTYAVVKGLFEVCVKPSNLQSTDTLDQLSPASLMTMLTNSDVARGRFVGNETLNGMAVKHYVIDGKTFLEAAQNSSDANLRKFGQSLQSAKDADLYVAADGGYPVAFRGSYTGGFDPLKFEGDYSVEIDLTGVNQNTPITLPAACNNPISQ
jgi:hypothetical protein